MIALSRDVPQYFFDDSLIAYQHRLERRWMPATVLPKPLIEPDRPWEGRALSLYGTVLPEPSGGYRMYYSDWKPYIGHKLFLATSSDGLNWEKPNLGIVEWQGSTDNNILLSTEWMSDSPNIIYEPDDPIAPYKMLLFLLDDITDTWGERWGLYAYTSRDGLHWEQVPGLRLRAGDRLHLLTEKVDGRYVAFTRRFPPDSDYQGGRAVWRTESEDFREWSTPELVMTADLDDRPNVEIYGLSAFRRHGWWFGLIDYWHGSPDVVETYLAISRDGKTWTRPMPRQPFIPATYDWNRCWTTNANNHPLLIGDQMAFYIGGRWRAHSFDAVQEQGVIGCASLPIDRFCALEGLGSGRLDIVPLVWPGGELVLNADTRKDYDSHPGQCNGEIAVEVLDAGGTPLPEWSGDNRAVFRGNTHCRVRIHDGTVRWPGGRMLDMLAGQTVRLRFLFDHARLYTFAAGS